MLMAFNGGLVGSISGTFNSAALILQADDLRREVPTDPLELYLVKVCAYFLSLLERLWSLVPSVPSRRRRRSILVRDHVQSSRIEHSANASVICVSHDVEVQRYAHVAMNNVTRDDSSGTDIREILDLCPEW